MAAFLVHTVVEVDTWRTHQLGNDNPLRPVDNEGPHFGHDWEVPEEDFLFFDFTCLFVEQAQGYIDWF